jgi:hypothetical protein
MGRGFEYHRKKLHITSHFPVSFVLIFIIYGNLMVEGVKLKNKVITPIVIKEKRVYCCRQIAAGYGIKFKIVLNRNRPKHFFTYWLSSEFLLSI